ncbi:hypothetical protein IVB18_15995 [Bradyrhizobium sp. 186]|uniref:hypothetical protein n=1 Tax=Bradyrhizobium sp. 186 TaxID=2782654 RepID=UPI0020013DD5|nr:hypothetical protein [Bradyrhizobium sp. 186]UPK38605.1 hypothetical protein IVB18_15995 [Bradyrhizobium sp. 186]
MSDRPQLSSVLTCIGRGNVGWVVSVVIAGCSLFSACWTIWWMDRGFDFTDEAFYLMWAQEPARFKIAYGLFGYGLHPLFELVGESVAGLRRLAALIAAALGALASLTMLSYVRIPLRSPAALQILSSSALLPFSYYVFWIPTPSYNWFALISGLFLVCALADLLRSERLPRSAFFASVSATLILFSRPQNALAYGCVYLAAALFFASNTRRVSKLLLAAGVWTVALLTMVAWWMPLNIVLRQIQSYLATFGASHPVHSSLLVSLASFFQTSGLLFLCSGLIFLITSVLHRYERLIPWLAVLQICASGAIALDVVLNLTTSNFVYRIGPTTGAIAYTVLSICRLRADADQRFITLMGWASLIPLAATFGSTDRISEQLNFFCGIWGIITTVASYRALHRFWCAGITVAWVVLVSAAVQIGLAEPYRLASPVKMQLNPTRVGNGSMVKLDEKTSKFVTDLQERAKVSGFCDGDSVLDLGSASPGVVFAIGGRAPTFPWIFAGYSFSERFAQQVIGQTDPQVLARTWLVLSESPRTFTPAQIQAIGIDLSSYRRVVKLDHPVTGYPVSLFAPPQLHPC